MKTTTTGSGLPPLTLTDACQITSIRVEVVQTLLDSIAEIEAIFEGRDLLEHYIEETNSWSDDIQTIVDHYYDLQRAYTAIAGGTFSPKLNTARFIEPQLKRQKRQPMGTPLAEVMF